jgi:hypothetical protein
MNTNGIQTGNAAFVAAQYYKTGDPMYDIPLTILITIVMGFLGTMITDFTTLVTSKIGSIWNYSRSKVRDLIYGKLNYVVVEHMVNNSVPSINNKLIIDAVRYNFLRGRRYQIENKEVKNRFMNEHNRESDRVLVKKIDETFREDGIIVTFECKTTVTNGNNEVQTKKNGGQSTPPQGDEIPYKEILTLSSYKSVDEIEKFIQAKKKIYIDKFCFKDVEIGVYPVFNYGTATNVLTFHKVPYESQKTFDSWFHQDKKKVLKIIDNFQHKTGQYSLRSCQNKLGILLYGLPGCGKTSFIKALATKLDRSIFPVSLDKLKSGIQLQDLFYNDYTYVYKNGAYVWDYIPLNKRIIVFEDIDTAGSIVMDRNKLKGLIEDDSKHSMINRYSFLGKMVKTLDGKKSDGDDKPINDIDFHDAVKHSSGITLGDLLNIFDGICEVNNLVYVITTNYVEYLDEALIRPGRITFKLEMSKMRTSEIIEMLTYYYINNAIYDLGMPKEVAIDKITEIASRLNGEIEPSKLEELCNNNPLDELYISQLGDGF